MYLELELTLSDPSLCIPVSFGGVWSSVAYKECCLKHIFSFIKQIIICAMHIKFCPEYLIDLVHAGLFFHCLFTRRETTHMFRVLF